MSLHPQPIGSVPEETVRVARAAFPGGHLYLTLRDEFGVIFSDEAFAPLFPTRGQPAEAPWRLALVSLLQYAENLADRQAADAVRSRIDWKYLLGLELTDAGFDSSVLSEFRSRLVAGSAEDTILNAVLNACRERQWLTARGRQRTDSTHVLGVVRALNRLECVIETMRHALNSVATAAPEWLLAISPSTWWERYAKRADDYRLPTSTEKRQAYARQVGEDGHLLLQAAFASAAPVWLAQLPAVETLRRVWLQQFYWSDTGVGWRTEAEGLPRSVQMISSPYDVEAHYAKKNTTSWIGYKVHVTETCENDQPHLITHVETTAAPRSDGDAVGPIHQALARRDLLPSVHLVDTGYVDAEGMVESKSRFGVDLYGPPRGDVKRQAAAAKGFASEQFLIDWQKQEARCPRGCLSSSWTSVEDRRGHPLVKIKFSSKDCQACSSRVDCTSAERPRRTLTIHPQAEHEALVAARQREQEPGFIEQYGKRAGIEGTLSQGVRAFGLRRSRYVGLTKTHLRHVLLAMSINLTRIGHWLAGESPAQTRQSTFAKLLQPRAA